MDNQTFNIELENTFNRARKMLMKKGIAYSGETDRLEQFKRAGVAQGITPESALMGMAMKHITKLTDMCKAPESYDITKWNEVAGDARNYILLLEALIRDRLEA